MKQVKDGKEKEQVCPLSMISGNPLVLCVKEDCVLWGNSIPPDCLLKINYQMRFILMDVEYNEWLRENKFSEDIGKRKSYSYG